MLALAAVEVPLVHLVVRHWSPTGATIFSVLGCAMMLAVAALAASAGRAPIEVGAAGLRVRQGLVYDARLAWDEIEAIGPAPPSGPRPRRRDVSAALGGAANVRVTLVRPRRVGRRVGGDRPVIAIDLGLDDPSAFLAAVRPWIDG